MVLELRSGAKINNNSEQNQNIENNNSPSPSKKICQNDDPNGMTLVVFIGLLIDLLAFTLILPLFPALLDHYKKHDSSHGLYHFLDSRVSVQSINFYLLSNNSPGRERIVVMFIQFCILLFLVSPSLSDRTLCSDFTAGKCQPDETQVLTFFENVGAGQTIAGRCRGCF